MRGSQGEISQLQDSVVYLQNDRKADGVVNAKPTHKASGKGIQPKSLTFEEFGRNNGNRMVVVEEPEDCWRELWRSAFCRNGGSHMMLDNKTEQK